MLRDYSRLVCYSQIVRYVSSHHAIQSISNLVYTESNNLEGQIPPEIGVFVAMTSYISFFNFQTGPIPTTLGYILPLQTFDVERNNLDGPLFQPENAGPDGLKEIVNFRASLNNFVGTIPAEIGQWTKTQNLWFADNQITGTIPTEIGTLTEMGE